MGFAFMYVVYHNDGLFEPWKCAHNAWPWHRTGPINVDYTRLLKKSTDQFVGTQFSIVLILFGAFYATDRDTTWAQFEVHCVGRIPDRIDMIVKLFAGLVIFDTIFYWTHLLEHKYLYAYHRVHHEYNNVNLPMSLTGTYGHWIDGLAGIALFFHFF